MAGGPGGLARVAQARLVVVTGLSGSGKGTVLRALEDAGFYTVDNLPVDLMKPFAESGPLTQDAGRAALVVDIREGTGLSRFPATFAEIRKSLSASLVFLETADAVLQRRFSETRRPHPAGGASVAESVAAERALLQPIRALADLELDTSRFNVHDLRRKVLEIFQAQPDDSDLRVTVGSFGFKYGPPLDGDLVLDVRFLPNPNYEPDCRHLTGRDAGVVRFLESYSETSEFLERAMGLLDFVVPRYAAEGKSYLSIYFGCTGGRHRSVYLAEAAAKRFAAAGRRVRVQHRDIDKEH
ncbi:MAG: RNase adapter RapZ [Bryobacterales bacterium]|nr:RNase adapter RapZ [Bryobacterales bacterium]MDE0262184.1 RNase adapter RapZ [Bryobacterales bacterium]